MTTRNAAGNDEVRVRTLCQYRLLAALTGDPTITTQEALTQHHLDVLQRAAPPRKPRTVTTRRTTMAAASDAEAAHAGPQLCPGR